MLALIPVCISARSGSCACTYYTPGWPSLACSWWPGLAVQKHLSEGKEEKVCYCTQDVTWMTDEWRIIILSSLMGKSWSNTGTWLLPACNWKQISQLLLPAFTAHVPTKGCRVCNLMILVCRQSLIAETEGWAEQNIQCAGLLPPKYRGDAHKAPLGIMLKRAQRLFWSFKT